MLGKNIMTLNLDEALLKDKCPICRIKRIRAEKYIWHLLYENVTDPYIQKKFTKSRGFCKEHNQLFIGVIQNRSLASCTSAASLLELVVPEYLKIIDNSLMDKKQKGKDSISIKNILFNRKTIKNKKDKTEKKTEKNNEPEKDCICCQIINEAVGNYLITLTEALVNEEYCCHYQASDGLCLPHFNDLVKYIDKRNDLSEVKKFLINDQKERLKKLQERLKQLQNKKRYDIKAPLNAHEASSWQEAIWRFTGWEPDQIISKL